MCEIDSSPRRSLAVSFWDLRLNPLWILGGGKARMRSFLFGGVRGRGGAVGEPDEPHWQQLPVCRDLDEHFIRNGPLSSGERKPRSALQRLPPSQCIMFVKVTGEDLLWRSLRVPAPQMYSSEKNLKMQNLKMSPRISEVTVNIQIMIPALLGRQNIWRVAKNFSVLWLQNAAHGPEVAIISDWEISYRFIIHLMHQHTWIVINWLNNNFFLLYFFYVLKFSRKSWNQQVWIRKTLIGAWSISSVWLSVYFISNIFMWKIIYVMP